MLAERFMAEAQSLRFYRALAMTRTKEIIALADWGYQYSLIRASPLPDVPVFLQQSCCGSRNAAHEVPAAPIRIMLETADIRKRSRMLWTHLCCLLQFWTDEAAYSEGNAFYGGYVREESCLVHYVMMRMNSRGRGEKVITWRDIVIGTPWLEERKEFSAAQEAAFRLQPSPAGPNELEREMEAWWQVEVLRKKCARPLIIGYFVGLASGCSTEHSGFQCRRLHPTGTHQRPPGHHQLSTPTGTSPTNFQPVHSRF